MIARTFEVKMMHLIIALKVCAFPNGFTLQLPPNSTLVQKRHKKVKLSKDTQWTGLEDVGVRTTLDHVPSSQKKLKETSHC